MERTTGQRWPRLRQRQTLQVAHPLDPMCDLAASSMGRFFVRDCGNLGPGQIYMLNGQPLTSERDELSRLNSQRLKWLSEIKPLTYMIITNLRTRFCNIVR